jgi:hypothetical protein
MRAREPSERACEPRAERKAEQLLAYYRTTRCTAYVMRHRPRERSMHQGCALGSVAFMILCSAVGSVIAEEKKPANAIRVLEATYGGETCALEAEGHCGDGDWVFGVAAGAADGGRSTARRVPSSFNFTLRGVHGCSTTTLHPTTERRRDGLEEGDHARGQNDCRDD